MLFSQFYIGIKIKTDYDTLVEGFWCAGKRYRGWELVLVGPVTGFDIREN